MFHKKCGILKNDRIFKCLSKRNGIKHKSIFKQLEFMKKSFFGQFFFFKQTILFLIFNSCDFDIKLELDTSFLTTATNNRTHR